MSTVNWGVLQQQAADATKLLDDGEYPVEVTESTATVSKAGGNPMIKLKTRIHTGPATGRVFSTQITMSDSGFALAMFFKSLAALGVTADVLAGGPSFEQVAAALVGRRALAIVDHSTYQGTERNGIKGFIPDPMALGQGLVVIAAALGGDAGGPVGAAPSGVPSAVPSSVPSSVPVVAGPSDVPVPSF